MSHSEHYALHGPSGRKTVLVASQQTQPATEELLTEALRLVQRVQLPGAQAITPAQHPPTSDDELLPVWQQRLTFLLALAYFQSGDYGKATLHFERVRDGYPELEDELCDIW